MIQNTKPVVLQFVIDEAKTAEHLLCFGISHQNLSMKHTQNLPIEGMLMARELLSAAINNYFQQMMHINKNEKVKLEVAQNSELKT